MQRDTVDSPLECLGKVLDVAHCLRCSVGGLLGRSYNLLDRGLLGRNLNTVARVHSQAWGGRVQRRFETLGTHPPRTTHWVLILFELLVVLQCTLSFVFEFSLAYVAPLRVLRGLRLMSCRTK